MGEPLFEVLVSGQLSATRFGYVHTRRNKCCKLVL